MKEAIAGNLTQDSWLLYEQVETGSKIILVQLPEVCLVIESNFIHSFAFYPFQSVLSENHGIGA